MKVFWNKLDQREERRSSGIFSRMTGKKESGRRNYDPEDPEWETDFRKQPEIFRKWEACGGSSPF